MNDPNRTPAIRVMMMPRDTNAHGTIFGGVILSHIDQAGAVAAIEMGLGKVVTVAMDEVVFHQPVRVGDLVSFYYPNQLGFFGRLGVALKHFWVFLSDSPREANTEGGIFPAIFGTFATSIVGVAIYSLVPFYNGSPAPPDWLLGILFGIGGLLGMYLGASCQRYVSERVIQVILSVIIFMVSVNYIFQFFR